MNHRVAILAGAGLGAGLMFTIDPHLGRRRSLTPPFQRGLSPSARALFTGLGVGLFLYGLTRTAPSACVLGTAGLALAAEGVINADVDDVHAAANYVADQARDVAANVGSSLGIEEQAPQTVGAD